MPGNRIWYLAALCGCGIFYIAYGEWFSFLLLVLVLGLPWLSLILSLPAIRSFRADAEADEALTPGSEGEAWLLGSCRYPMPPFRGKLRLRRCFTGEIRKYAPLRGLPTEHCGGIAVTTAKVRVCDYLGLFAFPVKYQGQKLVIVRPEPLPIRQLPDLKGFIPRVWRPKPGGGFAENHELRLYRPGDSLNQIHWKLSAKTGQLTLREPMEPRRGLVLITMTLRGTPEELDRKFGRLLWLGRHLLEQAIAFELRVLTADGIQALPIGTDQDLSRALDALLCAGAVQTGSIRDQVYSASWQYHIGGEPDEA